VRDLEKGGGSARDPQGKERFENRKLYRKRGYVEKLTTPIIRYFANIYLVEIMWSLEA
jgi:hypothetical protein